MDAKACKNHGITGRDDLNRESESALAYANTPEGRQARLGRVHEWQRDRLDAQQARDRLKQHDAHAWARREDATASPVLKAWRERERAREAAELVRQQTEQRDALLAKQTAQTSALFQHEQAAEARQPPPSFSYRPPRPAYWRERIRRANQSEAAREREDAAARYYERVMREQNTSHAPHAARPAPDIKPSRDPDAWWTDPQARDPRRQTETGEREKSRVELRKEQLSQHRGQRRTPPRR